MSPWRQATATNQETIASFGFESAVRESGKIPTAVPSSTAASFPVKSLHVPRVPPAHMAIPMKDADDSIADDALLRVDDWRLHKHADYQRVYQSSRKQFSTLMSYFAAPQPAEGAGAGPRVGITAGKVLGKAVDRNRIKRRMRAAIVSNLDALHAQMDVVLHPKRSVLDAEWTVLQNEVRRVFMKIQSSTQSAPERRA